MTYVLRATAAACGIYGTILTLSALMGLAVPCTSSANICRESKATALSTLTLSLVPLGSAGCLLVASKLQRGY